jgi:hypothetical protein
MVLVMITGRQRVGESSLKPVSDLDPHLSLARRGEKYEMSTS